MKKTYLFKELYYYSLRKKIVLIYLVVCFLLFGLLQANANHSCSMTTGFFLNVSDPQMIDVIDVIKGNSGSSFKMAAVQQQAVRGTITDASTGEPMAGVNVVVKGTTIGVMSDINGSYSLPAVDRNATLQFSFIGYISQEIQLGGRTVLNVALESEVLGLEEVIVIGYGTQKKESLTGAVSNIQTDELAVTMSTTVASAIQGKLPGVQIRQQTGEPGVFDSRISIRGFGEPLLVIDGVVRDDMSDFERLNPADIESVSVLKDASASIYGMNAANGVIIVTTKKGVAGKTQFSLSAVRTSKTPTVYTHQKMADAYTQRVMFNEMLRNSNLPPLTSDSELEKWRVGTEPGYTDYDWYGEMMRKWINSEEINFSARGGNDAIKFFTSFGYMNDRGYFKINELNQYDKFTFRTNVDATLAKGLTGRVSFYGRYDDQMQPARGVFWVYKRITMNDRGVGPYTLADNGHLSNVPPENTNPIAELSKDIGGYSNNLGFQYQTTINLDYKAPFAEGLSFGLLLAYDGDLNENRGLNIPFQLYDYKTDLPVGSPGLTSFSNTWRNQVRKNIQPKISYKRNIADAHNIDVTLVNDIKKVDYNYIRARRQYDDLYTHDIINQGSLTNASNEGYRTEEAYVSFLGRFNYDYRTKYLFEFTFREDGSYRYAPESRWAFFPAASLGWRIGQEDFIKNNLPWVSDIKIRGSYGKSGYDAGNAFEYIEGYEFSDINGGYVFNDNVLTIGMIPPGVVNNYLSWVETTTLDIGIDLELWKGKFIFNADYFTRQEEGLLATRITTVPNTFGADFPQENLNSQHTKGFEFNIGHRNTLGEFTYGLTANMTLSRLYYDHREQEPYRSTWSRWQSGSDGDGRITGRYFGYERDGIVNSVTDVETAPLMGGEFGNSLMLPGMDLIVDVNGDGVINSSDRLPNMFAGSGSGAALNPPLQFGLNIIASYLNFDFAIGFAGASMYTMAKSKNDQWGYMTRYPIFWSKYLDRWHTQSPDDNPFDPATVWIPGEWEALTANNTGQTSGFVTDKWRMNATFVRCKNLEIGYTLPTSFTRNFEVRAFVNAFNLFTITHKDLLDVDPERGEGAYGTSNTYPLMRTFNFGLDLKF